MLIPSEVIHQAAPDAEAANSRSPESQAYLAESAVAGFVGGLCLLLETQAAEFVNHGMAHGNSAEIIAGRAGEISLLAVIIGSAGFAVDRLIRAHRTKNPHPSSQ